MKAKPQHNGDLCSAGTIGSWGQSLGETLGSLVSQTALLAPHLGGAFILLRGWNKDTELCLAACTSGGRWQGWGRGGGTMSLHAQAQHIMGLLSCLNTQLEWTGGHFPPSSSLLRVSIEGSVILFLIFLTLLSPFAVLAIRSQLPFNLATPQRVRELPDLIPVLGWTDLLWNWKQNHWPFADKIKQVFDNYNFILSGLVGFQHRESLWDTLSHYVPHLDLVQWGFLMIL